jgi:hypothetical protein
MSDERFERIATADGVARDFCHVRLGIDILEAWAKKRNGSQWK